MARICTMGLRAAPAAAGTPATANTEQDLRRWAARMVRERDEMLAVVLFGSRARGTAGPDSDWDLALIAETGQPDAFPAAVPELGERVQAISILPSVLRAKRNAPGHIARNVLLDGQLLAGSLPAVGKIRRNPPMQPQEFQRMTDPIQEAVVTAGAGFGRAAEAGAAGDPDSSCAPAISFVRSAADAAEHLAKLMLVRRGLQPAGTHDLEALARQLENAESGQRANEAVRIRAMNGTTRQHRQASCTGVSPDDIRHAARRLEAFSRTVSEVFREAARSPALERVAKRRLTSLCQAAAAIRDQLDATGAAAAPAAAAATDIIDPDSPATAASFATIRAPCGSCPETGLQRVPNAHEPQRSRRCGGGYPAGVLVRLVHGHLP